MVPSPDRVKVAGRSRSDDDALRSSQDRDVLGRMASRRGRV